MTAVMDALEHTTSFERNQAIAEIDAEIADLNSRSLFGVEEAAREAVSARIWELQTLRAQTLFGIEYGYSKLDHETVLSWRHPGRRNPWPKLAVLSLHDQAMEFTAHTPQSFVQLRWSDRMTPSLPSKLRSLYDDVFARLHKHRRSMKLRFDFEGVIPAETRVRINHARSQFQDVYLLVEAPKESWKLTAEGPSSVERFYADPIVVGLAHDALWVIDVFDPTPIEDYVQSEFAS